MTHSDIIRKNWLVNPTGKPNEWRGVDWLVERNNLYTKVSKMCSKSYQICSCCKQVIHAGGSSNHTIEHIIKESPLIELYRECHMAVENGFHLQHRTVRHAPPDMTKTLRKLRQTLQITKPHIYEPARAADNSIPDQIATALNLLMTRKEVLNVDDEETTEVEGDDIGAE
jgi:hypothetical protein